MRNKTFILMLIIIPLLLVTAGVFYFFRSAQKDLEDVAGEKIASLEVLVRQFVISPVLSFDSQKIWFMTRQGRLFRIAISPPPLEEGGDEEGVSSPEEYLLPEPVEGTAKVIWQKDGGNFIVEQNIAGHSEYKFFDSNAGKFAAYPQPLTKPQFIPGNKIVYNWIGPELKHSLNVSDANGQNYRKVADLYREDYELAASPAKNEAMLFTRAAKNPSKLYLVNLDTGEFRALSEEANYQAAKFSPDGSKLAAIEDANLVIYDLALIQENFPSSPSLIKEGVKGEFIWDSNGQEIIIGSSNGLVKYNVATRQQETIYTFGAGENFVLAEMLAHPENNAIFFVDEQTRYLYQLSF